jgi:phenylacetate-CoA ligase
LIRYRIGDLAVAVDNSIPCKCGRGLSRIGAIEGRTQALVHCSNGRWLPGTFFAHFFKDYDFLIQFFQIVQERKGSFNLKYVHGLQWSEQGWALMIGRLREYVGDTEIVPENVTEIPLLKTGKRTPVVSTVRVDFQDL